MNIVPGPCLRGKTIIKCLEIAVDKFRTLSKQRQRYVAEVLERIAASGDDAYVLSDDERAAIAQAEAEIASGEVATAAEVRAVGL